MRNIIDRIIYDVELFFIKHTRDFAEWIYYKCFPDRVHDHEIANSPIPVIKEERYHPFTLVACEMIPEDIKFNNDEIRDLLARKLTSQIAEIIKIEKRDRNDFNLEMNFIEYRGEIKILTNQRELKITTEEA